ncbi:MAG: glycosyltransferase family 4 protein [Deltaproteobacteria bacterium]|nr:glycosyltransferase family 4 protein [Deltaproteobacteria bacterium]
MLLINYEFPPLGGGAGNATAHLAGELTRLGAEVLVVTSGYEGLPRREVREGFTVRRIPVLRRYPERCSPIEMLTFTGSAMVLLLQKIKAWRPHASLAFFGIPCGPVACWLKALRHVPYIVSLRGGDVPGFQPYDLAAYHRLVKPVVRFLWRRAAFVVANSEGLRDLASRTMPDLPIDVIPNGVDHEFFHPDAFARDPSLVRMLTVGRLVYQKGVDIALSALADIRQGAGPGIRLEVVGDGPERRHLEAKAHSLGIQDVVRFHGWVSGKGLLRLYQESSIFILPSRDEGMPNVVLEAMACGLPVAASRISGNEELVQDRETGLLVDPDSPASLAEALKRMISDSNLACEMGRKGRLLVQGEYSWHKAARSYLALLNRIPSNRESGPLPFDEVG